VQLYDSVGWYEYSDDAARLAKAFANSSFVVTARNRSELVGVARALSDDVSILYVQDVVVDPAYQRQGIGRRLLENCLERFAHVRQRVLLTDNAAHQHRLYRSVGFKDVSQLEGACVHAFVDIVGADLISKPDTER